jgi:hypothetical protein
MHKYICALLLLFPSQLSAGSQSRSITFEDRVQAQLAIERVYYAHQLANKVRFEDAVPRELIEKKVRNYLKQSVALAEIWHTRITAEALRDELKRIALGTHLPDRLREIYSALDDDPVLIQECFARPALVGRLLRAFFDYDKSIHASARAEAEQIRTRLETGDRRSVRANARRSEVTIARVREGSRSRFFLETDKFARTYLGEPGTELDEEEYEKWRSLAPDHVGEVGSLMEELDSFTFRVLVEDGPVRTSWDVYSVPKAPMESWLSQIRDSFDESTIGPVADASIVLPNPEGSGHHALAGVAETPRAYPDCDSWVHGSLDAIPQQRSLHTAGWTGSLMLVWGGYGPSGILSDG